MAKSPIRWLREKSSRVDLFLGWGERIWAWMPATVRTAIVTAVLSILAFVSGAATAAILWLGNFFRDYWTFALLAILAGAGVGTQLNGLVARIVAAMDRLVASRSGPITVPPPAH